MNPQKLNLNLDDIIENMDIDEIADFLGYVPMEKVFLYITEDMDRFKKFAQLVIKDDCCNFRLYEEYLFADLQDNDAFLSSKQSTELYEMFSDCLWEVAIDPIYDAFYDVRYRKNINDDLIQEYMDNFFRGRFKDVEQKIIERVKENLTELSEYYYNE